MQLTPWVLRLLLANVVVFILTMVGPDLTYVLMFVPAASLARPWTFITYMFVHEGIAHLLFNMLGLFFFGPRLEIELGGRRFLLLYFISGFTGAIFSFLTPYVAIVGASGAVFGVLMGYAHYWPRAPIYIWGILPIQARWLVIIMTLLSLFGGCGVGADNIAHLAHLGGFVGGYIVVKWIDLTSRAAQFRRSLEHSAMRKVNMEKWKKIDPARLHEVNRAEFERVMQKVHTSGVDALTETEIAFLNRFSQE